MPAPKPSATAAPKPAPKPKPKAPTNVYYKNCTAARDAGAAPVYRGDPGYGKHLDRDGDGVGCE
ncbi:MAG TPA: excalibur calcium-binding domain-containing protein [Actinomycetales bacterium]|nr:excalibur calcium-binding domain-containing protein [Actinomycetales bacterium]